MRKAAAFELYTDYLLANRGQVSAVGLSEVLGESMSHDHITRMLSQPELDQKEFWKLIKRNYTAALKCFLPYDLGAVRGL